MPYSIPLLIKRHIVLSHELTHRRLSLDTSLGFVLRFFGLGKIYLAGHRDAIGHAGVVHHFHCSAPVSGSRDSRNPEASVMERPK